MINTGARNQTGVSNFGRTLSKALGELGESWSSLDDRSEAGEPRAAVGLHGGDPGSRGARRAELYLGAEKKFELYNGSKMRAGYRREGSRSINLPELADRVTDAMNKGRMTIAKAIGELSLGDRMELERWREECAAMLSQVVSG